LCKHDIIMNGDDNDRWGIMFELKMHTQTDFAFEATRRHLSSKEAENDHIEDEIILSRCKI